MRLKCPYTGRRCGDCHRIFFVAVEGLGLVPALHALAEKGKPLTEQAKMLAESVGGGVAAVVLCAPAKSGFREVVRRHCFVVCGGGVLERARILA